MYMYLTRKNGDPNPDKYPNPDKQRHTYITHVQHENTSVHVFDTGYIETISFDTGYIEKTLFDTGYIEMTLVYIRTWITDIENSLQQKLNSTLTARRGYMYMYAT